MTTEVKYEEIKPSDILIHKVPFIGTMGSCEIEYAVAWIIRACQVHGDKFQAISRKHIQDAAALDISMKEKSILWINPFGRPDFYKAVDLGFLKWTGEIGTSDLEVTDLAKDALKLYTNIRKRSN